ncbi:MAG TPA: type II toxin-antitoxin system VapC family toxin [Candidatus Dormibacteraeota bacterium]|nr:type II toxin-antitoxin system VapC family toxin [Candidatus Dormibacteraeota bacterium]
MIVIDASVLVAALIGDDPSARRCRTELRLDPHWITPADAVVETYAAILNLADAGTVSEDRARLAVDLLASLELELFDIRPQFPRMWRLRGSLGHADASLVVAALANDCELLTADPRLAEAARGHCAVRLLHGLPPLEVDAHASAGAGEDEAVSTS